MIELNFKAENKMHVEGEKYHNYSYYDFNEQSVREIASKHAKDVTGHEWYSLVQMLYPKNLITSGLFDAFLVFDIINRKRKDPPKEYWNDLVTPGSDGVLLERIISALSEHKIDVHESWKIALKRASETGKEEN